MITYSEKPYDLTHTTFKFKGLSTDTKPTGRFNGRLISGESSFFEKDTQTPYFYDNNGWLPQPTR